MEGGDIMISLSIFILAISLSVDSLGVGVSYGLRNTRTTLAAKFIIFFISVLFTAVSIIIGSTVSDFLNPMISKVLGSTLLMILGFFIIVKTLVGCWKNKNNIYTREENKDLIISNCPTNYSVKNISNNVKKTDHKLNNLSTTLYIDYVEAIYLGVALSVDSLVAGISSAATGLVSISIPFVVGLFQIVFLTIGEIIGSTLVAFQKVKPIYLVFLSGILLIVLSLARLFY